MPDHTDTPSWPLLATQLRALAEDTRLAILANLQTGKTLAELATRVNKAKSTVHAHLGQLEGAHFVRQEMREGGLTWVAAQEQLFSFVEDLRQMATLSLSSPSGASMTEGAPATAAFQRRYARELILLNGLVPDRSWHVLKSMQIGRDTKSAIAIPWDIRASAKHALVEAPGRATELVDLMSTNGTLVNGTRLPHGGRTPLRSGDVVGIGRTQFLYRENPG